MSKIKKEIIKVAVKEIGQHFSTTISEQSINIQFTKKEFEGDYTIVFFDLSNILKVSPKEIALITGQKMLENHSEKVKTYNVIGGFLNLVLKENFLVQQMMRLRFDPLIEHPQTTTIVEYSSPNTNKPLHLGHLRNIFLGYSITQMLKFSGKKVYSTCVVNDRGIHICKSMLAWQKFGNAKTPQTQKQKPDHFVGDFYVKYNEHLNKEIENIQKLKAINKKEAETQSSLSQEAKQLLQKWENKDPEVLQVWNKMNQWVYEGFNQTYQKINIDFDKTYYESKTYLLGKQIIKEGLKQNVFFEKEDGSVWIDLTDKNQDEKLLLRKDGTSVYITQDLGLAQSKYEDFNYDESIYVVGDEQNYHFEVLKNILLALKKPFASGIKHLSYGMVELPSGKMKSREGTVVDADDILEEIQKVSKEQTKTLGKVEGMSEKELFTHSKKLGYGALRFFLLRSDPKKKILYDPKEMIDLNGYTSVFINYSYVRILSLLEKEKTKKDVKKEKNIPKELHKSERELILHLENFLEILSETIKSRTPSVLASYAYVTAKYFNTMYNKCPIIKAEKDKKQFRLILCEKVLQNIKTSMNLLGIELVKKM